MSNPLKVFISYAHEDQTHREALGKHLRPLEREGLITLWHDRKITAGREWAGAIDSALKDAEIVLLLVSADFVDSDYSNDVELNAALRMHAEGRARVVPVILRSVDWQRSRFASLNALPPDGEPIVEAEHPDQQFTAVAKGLRDVVDEILSARAAPGTREAQPDEARTDKAPGAIPAGQPLPERRHIKIGNIGGKWLLRGVGAGVVLLAIAGSGACWLYLQSPMAEARDHMRIARYDLALEALKHIPAPLERWSRLGFIRNKAALGLAWQTPQRDIEKLGKQLEALVQRVPNDPDLLVMQAQRHLDNVTSSMHAEAAEHEAKKLLERASAATQADERHAEAWYLRGLGHFFMAGDPAATTEDYRRAADYGPNSPQYRSNYARSLLDQGRASDAVREYGLVKKFALARVEEALALWAQGRFADAAQLQREALNLLDDATLKEEFYNRRSWVFVTPEKGLELISQKDKRCYAQLGRAVSEQLSEGSSAPFAPAACSDDIMWVWIRKLVAHDICRFVEKPNAKLAQKASRLRQSLGESRPCIEQSAPSQPQTNT